MSERLNASEQVNNFKEVLSLVETADINVLNRLKPTNRQAARDEFIKNPRLSRPNFEYDNLREDEIVKNLKTLNLAREKLATSNLTDNEKLLTDLILENNQKKNDFLAANFVYNHAPTNEEKETASRLHKLTNEALYGKADEDTFYALLKKKLDKIDENRLSFEEQIEYKRLLKNIGPIKESESAKFQPSQETVDTFKEQIITSMWDFYEHIPEDKESFSSEDMVNIANEIITEELNGKYTAEINPNSSSISVDNHEWKINIPADKTYSSEKATALILHELGTHMNRAFTYGDSDIGAFAKGLPNYTTFDEGLAMCIEQSLAGEYEDRGVNHYINIGLATFKNKNFREVYEISKSLALLTHDDSYDDNKIFENAQRCFRGTGELPNNKDLAYYNGAVQVWQYIEEHISDPELLNNLFNMGKVNLLDPRQAFLAEEMKMQKI